MNRAEGNDEDGLRVSVSTELDDSELRAMMSVAAYRARQVGRSFGLSAEDRRDVEHDILLAILRRRRFFDPDRGAWSTFVRKTLDDIVIDVARRLKHAARRRDLSLDGPSSSSAEHGESLEAVLSSGPSHEAATLLALSLEQFLATLPESHGLVARLVLEEDGDVAEARRRSGLSTSEFYRRLHEVRMRMRCMDLVRLPRAANSVAVRDQDAA